VQGATYSWNLDIATKTGRVVEQTFDDSQAQYNVILTVTRNGQAAYDSVTISVPC